jgi:hypothetical protein
MTKKNETNGYSRFFNAYRLATYAQRSLPAAANSRTTIPTSLYYILLASKMPESQLARDHPETVFSDVILRSKATKNLIVKAVSRDSSLRSE